MARARHGTQINASGERWRESQLFVNALRDCLGLDPLYENPQERAARHRLEQLRRFVRVEGDGHRRNGGPLT